MTARVLAHLGLVLAGLLAGLALLLAVELALRLLGIGANHPRHNPFAGFSRAVPTFELDNWPDGTRIYRLAAARRKPAAGDRVAEPQREFLAEKAPDTLRIFVLGGSSAAGVPMEPDTLSM